MPANAGQQVRGDRAKRSNDQGHVQERTQQLRHEQAHSVEPSCGSETQSSQVCYGLYSIPTPTEEAYFEALGVPYWSPEEQTTQRLKQHLSK